MLENSVFRMVMFIGAVIVVGLGIRLLVENVPTLYQLFDSFFSARLQKY